MRQCINPDCSAFAEGRTFNADDLICPRCGNALAEVSDTGVITRVARRVDPPMSQAGAFLLALVTFVGVIGVALALAGLLRGFNPPPGGANPTAGATPPAVATTGAAATRTAIVATLNTPIPIINLPTPAGGTGGSTGGTTAPGGTGATGPTSTPVPGVETGDTATTQSGTGPTSAVIPGVSAVRLCRRIAASEACDPVTAFGSRDDINIAVQAGFGPGGARSARAEWYGPNGTLLQASDPVTPGRTGTYWVGFTIKQSQPWTPGVYRALIYLDNTLHRQIDIPVIP
jgi:hypothetical protein